MEGLFDPPVCELEQHIKVVPVFTDINQKLEHILLVILELLFFGPEQLLVLGILQR